jgi:type IV pilus assembly protein PilW
MPKEKNKRRTAGGVQERGFTLVEILVAMSVMTIVTGAIYGVFFSSNRSYRTQERVVDAQQKVRMGIDFMMRDIRMAGYDPKGNATDAVEGGGAGIKSATATQIRFASDMDMDGTIEEANRERVTYTYDADTNEVLQILYEGTGSESEQTLMDDVSALSFGYLDKDGNTVAVPVDAANLANIRTVVVVITCRGQDAQGNPFTRTLNARAICRNLNL